MLISVVFEGEIYQNKPMANFTGRMSNEVNGRGLEKRCDARGTTRGVAWG